MVGPKAEDLPCAPQAFNAWYNGRGRAAWAGLTVVPASRGRFGECLTRPQRMVAGWKNRRSSDADLIRTG